MTTISDSAFYCCLLGDTIVIPKSVTYVGNGAFYPSQFDALVVEPGNPCYDSRDNCNALIETATNELIVGCKSTKFPRDLTAIRPSAFIGATELQDVDLPETLREIGQDAFVESGVREVVLPASIKELPRYVFQYCGNLNRITLNEGLRSIGVGALSHCAYRELIIPDSVEELADYACDWCVNLRTLTIGSGVRAIGIGAFSECKRLSKVVSRIPAENLFPVHNSAFSGIDEDCVLYVPRGAKDAYENTDGWNTFGEIREF